MPKKRSHGGEQEYIPAGNGLASGTYASDDGNNEWHQEGKNTSSAPLSHIKKPNKSKNQHKNDFNNIKKDKINIDDFFNKKDEKPKEKENEEIENKLIENMVDVLQEHPEMTFNQYIRMCENGFGKNRLNPNDVKEFFGEHKDKFVSLWEKEQEKIVQQELDKFNKLPSNTELSKKIDGVNKKNYAITKLQKAYNQITQYEYDKYHANCFLCVQAFELRMRGYDVEAKPTPKDYSFEYDKLLDAGFEMAMYVEGENGYDAYGSPNFNKTPKNTVMKPLINTTPLEQKGDIERIVKETGDGSRFVCGIQFKTGEYHIFNIINDNGIVKFIDAQSGNENATHYFEKDMITLKETMLVRVDNLKLNKNVNLVAKGV